MYRKFKKVFISLLAHVTPSSFFRRDLRSEALVYNSYFFSGQPFYGNYFTLDSHINTVISHAFAYSSRWWLWQGLLSQKLPLERKYYVSWTEKLSGSEMNCKFNELTWILFFHLFLLWFGYYPSCQWDFSPGANENTSVSQRFQSYGKFCRPNGYQASYNPYY